MRIAIAYLMFLASAMVHAESNEMGLSLGKLLAKLNHSNGDHAAIQLSENTVNKPESSTHMATEANDHSSANSDHNLSEKGGSDKGRVSNKMAISPRPAIDIVIDDHYLNSPKVLRLYKLLGFKDRPKVIHLVDDPSIASDEDDIVAFKQRTFLSALYYLRNAVEITPEMIKCGLIDVPKLPNGQYYNLTNITKGVLHIHVSKTRPRCDVNVAVFYRNHWFYIKDSDIPSKRTFAMMQLLFNLLASDRPGQSAPVITVPVR